MTYHLTKLRFPFDTRATWVLHDAVGASSPLGDYRTKREAEQAARRLGVTISEVIDQTKED